jgi:purine-binding chemotaxis protein CheW
MAEKSNTLHLLHFCSGNRDYAMDLGFVKEIIRMCSLNKITELPDFVKGLINLRGETLPVIDFLTRSGAGETTIRLKTRIVILKIKTVTMGLVVDEVKETFEVDETEISKNIQPDVVIDPKYILGSFLLDGRMILWIDIQKLLTAGEFVALEKGVSNE